MPELHGEVGIAALKLVLKKVELVEKQLQSRAISENRNQGGGGRNIRGNGVKQLPPNHSGSWDKTNAKTGESQITLGGY
ncbi:unnamed protein product [Phytophthora fragariaefolia]|uniref:Unnamed protein product n=1 Tax=Phytophthora fragariaefolia TaxID=1490495 RepID=A0A9W6U7Z7_9STRA|nr:unnamed protein product [Phytophthora fragariaefolia]